MFMNKIVNVNLSTDYSNEIHYIEKCCFPGDAWSLNSVKESISNPHSVLFVCIDDDKVIGFINIYNICGEAELNRIAVLEEYRKNNVASSMLKNALIFLADNGCTRIVLEVRSLNISAINLYKKFGFKTDCVRKNYYQNPSDDAVLMSLNI